MQCYSYTDTQVNHLLIKDVFFVSLLNIYVKMLKLCLISAMEDKQTISFPFAT